MAMIFRGRSRRVNTSVPTTVAILCYRIEPLAMIVRGRSAVVKSVGAWNIIRQGGNTRYELYDMGTMYDDDAPGKKANCEIWEYPTHNQIEQRGAMSDVTRGIPIISFAGDPIPQSTEVDSSITTDNHGLWILQTGINLRDFLVTSHLLSNAPCHRL